MERQGESKLGIASLILSLISLITFVLKAALTTFHIASGYAEISSFITLIGLIIIFNTFLSLVSLCLGLVGIFQKTRVRKLAFIGTTISSALLVFYLSVIIVSF